MDKLGIVPTPKVETPRAVATAIVELKCIKIYDGFGFACSYNSNVVTIACSQIAP